MKYQPSTVREILNVASGKLALSSPTGLLDSKIILKYISKMTDVDLILKADEILDEKIVEEYFKLIDRRFKGEPVSYITGVKSFMNLDFKVNKNVLIPRPETELLVEKVLERLDDSKKKGFEVGLGSGNISISLLKNREKLTMTATDISLEAIKTALENIEQYQLEDRISVNYADIYSKECGGNFDFLVSNPPYITEKEYSSLMADVKEYEPELALLAGEDGCDCYKKIIKTAPLILKEGAFIAFEIGANQALSLKEILINEGFSDVAVYKDLAGRDRVIMGELKNVK